MNLLLFKGTKLRPGASWARIWLVGFTHSFWNTTYQPSLMTMLNYVKIFMNTSSCQRVRSLEFAERVPSSQRR